MVKWHGYPYQLELHRSNVLTRHRQWVSRTWVSHTSIDTCHHDGSSIRISCETEIDTPHVVMVHTRTSSCRAYAYALGASTCMNLQVDRRRIK